MSTLRIGYNLFKGASQSSSALFGGTFQVETAKAKKYLIKVTRTADGYYWNHTSGAFQSGAVAEGDEMVIPGSDEANPKAYRRLEFNLPEALRTALTTGCTVTAYATGDTPSSAGVDIVLEAKP